jgi:ADP-ribose pyrophosphatase YjhB (NUDIX family)
MPIPDFIVELRRSIGTAPLWLSGVTAVVTRGDDLLMVRRADTGAWTPVTGIIDPGEQPAVAARREVLEEADVVVEVEKLASVLVSHPVVYDNGDRTQYLDLVFLCRWVSGEPRPADGENLEARWFPRDGLPELSPDFADRIASALAGVPEARFET